LSQDKTIQRLLSAVKDFFNMNISSSLETLTALQSEIDPQLYASGTKKHILFGKSPSLDSSARSTRKRSASNPPTGKLSLLSNARVSLHIAEVHTIQALISEEKTQLEKALEEITLVEKMSSEAISFLSKLCVSKKSTAIESEMQKHARIACRDAEVCHAFALLWRACIQFRTGSFLKGAYNLRSSWKGFEALLSTEVFCAEYKEKDQLMSKFLETFIKSDVLFGAGAFRFLVSLVPPAFQTILEVIGFEGDRERGRRNLIESFESEGNKSHLALLISIWIESAFYENRTVAEEMIQTALKLYPTGSLFLFLGGYLWRKEGKLDKAFESFQRAKESSVEFETLQLICTYELGWCHYMKNDFESASTLLQTFVERFQSPSFRAFAAFQLGYAYDQLNEIDKAKEAMSRVSPWVRANFTWDQYADRKALEYLKNPGLSKFNRLLVCLFLSTKRLTFTDRFKETMLWKR